MDFKPPPCDWNTLQFSICGAFVGMLYAAYLDIGLWTRGPDMVAQALGGLAGGALGAAALVAIVCGIRNLFVRIIRKHYS
jgi:hypothetical protein